MDYEATHDYIIVEKLSSGKEETKGFQVVGDPRDKEISVGKIITAGDEAMTKGFVRECEVMYFEQSSVALGSRYPNMYVLKMQDIFAIKGEEEYE